jgi:S1-C subfamily serine protease
MVSSSLSLRVVSVGLLLAILLVRPMAGGEGVKCNESPKECEKKIRQILSSKRFLGVTFDSSKGLFVKSVIPDSPAERAGIQPGDVIMIMNGQDCSRADVKKFKEMLHSVKEGSRVTMIVRRDGTFKTLTPQLAAMTEKQIESAIEAHLKEAHSDTARQ